MKLENLIRKGRNGIAAGLFGIAAISNSVYAQQPIKTASGNVSYIPCRQAEAGRDDWGALLTILGGAMQQSNKQDEQQAGALITTYGAMQHQKEVAEAGRSQISITGEQNNINELRYMPAQGCAWVNPENPSDLSVRVSLGIPFAANGWQDLNYNKYVESNEFIGVKNQFYENENIIMGLFPRFMDINKVKFEIYGPNGDKIREGNTKSAWIEWDPQTDFRGHGIYTIVWRDSRSCGAFKSGDCESYKKITEMMRFEILPSSQRPQN